MPETGVNLYQDDKRRAWYFLRSIVSRLLVREQQKMLAPFRHRVSADARIAAWTGWDDVYGVEEQCERVLCQSLGLVQPRSTNLPLEIQESYNDIVSNCI